MFSKIGTHTDTGANTQTPKLSHSEAVIAGHARMTEKQKAAWRRSCKAAGLRRFANMTPAQRKKLFAAGAAASVIVRAAKAATRAAARTTAMFDLLVLILTNNSVAAAFCMMYNQIIKMKVGTCSVHIRERLPAAFQADTSLAPTVSGWASKGIKRALRDAIDCIRFVLQTLIDNQEWRHIVPVVMHDTRWMERCSITAARQGLLFSIVRHFGLDQAPLQRYASLENYKPIRTWTALPNGATATPNQSAPVYQAVAPVVPIAPTQSGPIYQQGATPLPTALPVVGTDGAKLVDDTLIGNLLLQLSRQSAQMTTKLHLMDNMLDRLTSVTARIGVTIVDSPVSRKGRE
jgi:hypothetical protein